MRSTEEDREVIERYALSWFAFDIVQIKFEGKSLSKFKEKQKSKLGSHELIKYVREGKLEQARTLLLKNPMAVNSSDLAKMNVNCAHIAVLEKNF